MPTPLDVFRHSTPVTPAPEPEVAPLRARFEYGIRHSLLPTTARLVALTIATWADTTTGVIPPRDQPGIGTISHASGLTISTVKRCLAILETGGWIERHPAARPMQATTTTLAVPQPRTPGEDAHAPHTA